MRAAVLLVLLGACGRWGFDAGRDSSDAPHADDGGADTDATERPNRMFVSTPTYTGNMGGIAGANLKCQVEANAAGVGGTWVAFLYTLADTPAAPLAGSRGWVDMVGTPIGDTPSSLVSKPLNPLRVDVNGNRVTQWYSWWGGHPIASGTCMDWTTTALDANGTHEVESDSSFNTDVYTLCSEPTHLMCAEIGHVVPVTPPPSPGRNAFVTRGKVNGAIGLAGADSLCQTEATAAVLPGTYRAFLTTTAGLAETRFSTAGLPWRRVDGMLLAPTATALMGAQPQDPWESFIARFADGTETNERIWVGTTFDNCVGWTSASSAINGRWGGSHATRRSRLSFGQSQCNNSYSLLCFET